MTTNVFDKVLHNIESDIAAYKSSGISVCEDMANNRIVFWDMNGNNPQQAKYDVDAYKAFLTALQDRYELTETERGTLGSPFSYKYTIKPKQNNMATTETSLMKQYEEMKKKHPDAVLLFRVGDFYELFKEDAKTASEILGLTLTSRTDGNGRV